MTGVAECSELRVIMGKGVMQTAPIHDNPTKMEMLKKIEWGEKIRNATCSFSVNYCNEH